MKTTGLRWFSVFRYDRYGEQEWLESELEGELGWDWIVLEDR